LAENGALIVRAMAIATVVPKIFRKTVMMILLLVESFALPAEIWITRPSGGAPTVVEGCQQQPVYFTPASPAIG
jgi:hypothetical protein